MGVVIAMIISFVLGGLMDHFLEARTAAQVTKALEHLGDRIVAEIRKAR